MQQDTVSLLLSERLKLLTRLRGEVDQFYNDLEAKTISELGAAIKSQTDLFTTGDVAAQIITSIIGLGALCKTYGKTMGKTGKELADANSELLKDVIIEKGKQAHNLTGALAQGFNADEPWLVFATSFMNPSYWMEILGLGKMQMQEIMDDVLRQGRMQKVESLQIIDRKIKAVDQLRKAANQGLDLCSLA